MSVTDNSHHSLICWHPNLFDRIQCMVGFRQADVGAKEIAILTLRAVRAAVPIPLTMNIIGHKHNIIQNISNFCNGEALKIPV